MRQYRPTIEELKKRYAAEMAQRQSQQNGDIQHDARPLDKRDLDDAALIGRQLPNSLAECFRISDEIGRREEEQARTKDASTV